MKVIEKLIQKLEEMIELVEVSDHDFFVMSSYSSCVIGKCIYGGNYWDDTGAKTFRRVIGVPAPKHIPEDELFFVFSLDDYNSKNVRSVVELYTSHFHDYATKKQWLELANIVLENLKNNLN